MSRRSDDGSAPSPGFSRSQRRPPRLNRLHRALLEVRGRAGPILDLTRSNPGEAGIELPLDLLSETWREALRQPYQPDPRGSLRAREAISGYYAERGQDIDPADILLTASTSEAYSLCFKLFADPGQEVLVPSPSYPLLSDLCRLEKLTPHRYRLERTDRSWSLPDPLPHRRSSRILLLVNPNNPTGSILSEDDWQLVEKSVTRRGILLLCDEVFSDYTFTDRPAAPPPGLDLPRIRLNGISKIAGLPQLKLAWLIVEGPRKFKESTLQRLECMADSYLSVNTPVQWLLPRVLAVKEQFQAPIQRRITRNRTWAERFFLHQPIEFLAPEAGWNALLRLPRIHSDEEWSLELLGKRNLLVHPGYLFGFQEEGFLVVSLLSKEADFQTGLKRMLEMVRT